MWTSLLIARSTMCLQTANDTTAPAKPAGAGPQLKLLVDKRSRRRARTRWTSSSASSAFVLFVEADADVSLEEFGDSLCPPIPCTGHYSMCRYVTRLRCGGFVFSTQICHNLVDAAGITQFLQAVGELVEGAERPAAREPLDSRHPPRPAYDHPEYELASDEASDKLRPGDELVHRRFLFGLDDVAALRDQLPTCLGPGAHVSFSSSPRAQTAAFRRLQPPTPPFRLLRPRAAACCRSPAATAALSH
uniref:Uncharacterized protein n=1 Tax=Oryza glumipatula TaxID=40148 RepID=A0A0D9YWV7_9ORYZ